MENISLKFNRKSVNTALILHKNALIKLKMSTFPWVKVMNFSFDGKNFHATEAFIQQNINPVNVLPPIYAH